MLDDGYDNITYTVREYAKLIMEAIALVLEFENTNAENKKTRQLENLKEKITRMNEISYKLWIVITKSEEQRAYSNIQNRNNYFLNYGDIYNRIVDDRLKYINYLLSDWNDFVTLDPKFSSTSEMMKNTFSSVCTVNFLI